MRIDTPSRLAKGRDSSLVKSLSSRRKPNEVNAELGSRRSTTVPCCPSADTLQPYVQFNFPVGYLRPPPVPVPSAFGFPSRMFSEFHRVGKVFPKVRERTLANAPMSRIRSYKSQLRIELTPEKFTITDLGYVSNFPKCNFVAETSLIKSSPSSFVRKEGPTTRTDTYPLPPWFKTSGSLPTSSLTRAAAAAKDGPTARCSGPRRSGCRSNPVATT
jgi:hypothetical protein